MLAEKRKFCEKGFRISKKYLFLCCVSILLQVTFCQEHALPSVAEFFPQLNGDLTAVTWAHAVNSEEELKAAIDGSAMMLEADLLMGTKTGSTEKFAIMAHPPNLTTNLTFTEFLDNILKVNNELKKPKGIKLDFKDSDSMESVLTRLESEAKAGKLNFPVWLNADVLKGPIHATKEPINGTSFVSLAKRHLPTATLSLGWTTRYGAAEFDGVKPPESEGYTAQNIDEMLKFLTENPWQGPITFAVRAGLLKPKESRTNVLRLLATNRTLTIWSAKDDHADATELHNWIALESRSLKGQVYFDLPREPPIVPSATVPPPTKPTIGRMGDGSFFGSDTGDSLTLSYVFVTGIVLVVFLSIVCYLYRTNREHATYYDGETTLLESIHQAN